MHKYVSCSELPETVQRALGLLRDQRPGVVVSDPWVDQGKDGKYLFDVQLGTVSANGEKYLARTEMSIDTGYPYSEVEVFLKEPKIQGEKHQSLSTGKLCLDPRLGERVDEEKIVDVVDNALQWVADALNDRLVAEGDPYECPDFRHGHKTIVGSDLYLVYREDCNRFTRIWERRICQWGFCELHGMEANSVYAFVSATGRDGEVVFADRDWSCQNRSDQETIKAVWCLVDEIVYEFHRPPVDWSELRELLTSCGCDAVVEWIRKTWCDSKDSVGYVLVGWPIPKKYEGPVVMCCWKAVAFETFHAYKARMKKLDKKVNLKKMKPHQEWKSAEPNSDAYIKWCPSENVSYEDLTSRWVLHDSLAHSAVAILGCGAVGSSLADQLARGGVSKFYLVDPEVLEYGNLARHILTGRSVQDYKVNGLRQHLGSIAPFMTIERDVARLPCVGEDSSVSQKILDYDLLVDCTGNFAASAWLSCLARKRSRRLVWVYLNSDATYLTGIFSGRNMSCRQVSDRFCNDLCARREEAEGRGLLLKDYEEKELPVRRPGCWHPTYSGSWIDIQSLVGCLVKKLEDELGRKWGCSGRVVVFKCSNSASDEPSVRCVWDERYQ